MRTLKQLKAMKSVSVKRIAKNMPTIEDIPQMRENIIKQLAAQGAPEGTLEETETEFRVGNQFILKPKVNRIIQGTIRFKSKGYTFEYSGKQSRGDCLKASMLTEYGFKVDCFNGGSFEYHIIES